MPTPQATRSHARQVLVLAAAAALTSCAPPASQDAPAGEEAPTRDMVFETLSTTLVTLDDKLTQLLGAFEGHDLDWRPMEGVRSAREVYLHVTADNYFMPALMGVAAPQSTGITTEYATAVAFESREMTYAELSEEMAASFAHLREAMDATADDLEREIDFGSNTATVGELWVQTVTHLHEHLGQSIAYARANEVVPPWSK